MKVRLLVIPSFRLPSDATFHSFLSVCAFKVKPKGPIDTAAT